jgi:hypothetical protein
MLGWVGRVQVEAVLFLGNKNPRFIEGCGLKVPLGQECRLRA